MNGVKLRCLDDDGAVRTVVHYRLTGGSVRVIEGAYSGIHQKLTRHGLEVHPAGRDWARRELRTPLLDEPYWPEDGEPFLAAVFVTFKGSRMWAEKSD